jgi:hypothetical protein
LPVNKTSLRATVRSPWALGHINPKQDAVGLTLVSTCLTAAYYAYLSRNWTQPAQQVAADVLAVAAFELEPANIAVVDGDHDKALVMDQAKGAAALVVRATPSDFYTLVTMWRGRGCQPSAVERRELSDSIRSFKVAV